MYTLYFPIFLLNSLFFTHLYIFLASLLLRIVVVSILPFLNAIDNALLIFLR